MKPSFFLPLAGALVVVVACGGSVQNDPTPGEACTDCALPDMVQTCADGTIIGAKCAIQNDGSCAAYFPDCPASSDAGVGVDAANPPGAAGASCGGTPAQGACGASLYCRSDGACGGIGQCVPRPAACDENYDPVCGCDGKTYGNACSAAAAGASVASKGECAPTGGAACGTRGAPTPCGKGTFCKRDIAAACGETDAPGACSPIPTGCGKNLDPVCGCDGTTYTNPCEADRASMSVRSTGECP